MRRSPCFRLVPHPSSHKNTLQCLTRVRCAPLLCCSRERVKYPRPDVVCFLSDTWKRLPPPLQNALADVSLSTANPLCSEREKLTNVTIIYCTEASHDASVRSEQPSFTPVKLYNCWTFFLCFFFFLR